MFTLYTEYCVQYRVSSKKELAVKELAVKFYFLNGGSLKHVYAVTMLE